MTSVLLDNYGICMIALSWFTLIKNVRCLLTSITYNQFNSKISHLLGYFHRRNCIVAKIKPKASNGHRYILVVVDDFSKWVEVASYSKLGTKQVAKFVINYIISRLGVLFQIASNNGAQFEGNLKKIM